MLFMLFIFLEVIMLFSWKGGVNFYIFLWNAKFMQETLQESNENMYCHNLWWAASSIQD